MPSISGGQKWTPLSTCTAQCCYRRISTNLCECGSCGVGKRGGGLCSSVSNFLKILNLLDKIVSTILSRIVGTLREIEKLQKLNKGSSTQGVGGLRSHSEFKIYEATVAKTSLKIASSSLTIFFVVISISLNFLKLAEIP